MSTVTYADQGLDAADAVSAKPVKKPLLTRIYDVVVQSQQRRAEIEIGRYLANRGQLTDEIEREIMRKLGAGPR